jgi:hypothetical protein
MKLRRIWFAALGASAVVLATVAPAHAAYYSSVWLYNVHSNQCVATDTYGDVFMENCGGSDVAYQNWNVIPDNGQYEIQSVQTGQCIYGYYLVDDFFKGTVDMAQTKSCYGSPHELWSMGNGSTSGTVTFHVDHGCLDSGQKYTIYTDGTCNPNNTYQEWYLD